MTINPLDELYSNEPYLPEDTRDRFLDPSGLEVVEEEENQGSSQNINKTQSTATPSKGGERRKATNAEVIDNIKGLITDKPGYRDSYFNAIRNDMANKSGHWTRPQNYAAAAGAGLVDTGIGLVNKVFKTEIPYMPEYQSKNLEAIKNISSQVIPTLYLTKFLGPFGAKGTAAINTKTGWSLGKDAFTRWLGRASIATGAGLAVDEVAPILEKDHNLGGFFKETWPQAWSWYPQEWATLGTDSPERKRNLNKWENAGIGLLGDITLPIARLLRSKQNVRVATEWVPKNEKGKAWLKAKNNKPKLSKNPLENDVLQQNKQRHDELVELGQDKIDDGVDLSRPVKGVHDAFDYPEAGIRKLDDGGIVAAASDQFKIVKNYDTRYGRVGNFISAKNLRRLLTGKENPIEFFKKLGKELDETKVDFKASKGRVIKHSDTLLEAEKLAAELYETDLEGIKSILRPLSSVDPTTGARKLVKSAEAGVMEAVKKYSDDFINLKLARAQGLAATSTAGQISDIAETTRLLQSPNGTKSTYTDILDRLELLMTLQAQTKYTKDQGRNINSIIKAVQNKTRNLSSIDAAKAINEERNNTLRALDNIKRETQQTIETLRQVKAERPEMLSPLMLAYEMTDGSVKSMSSLNRYIRNTSGTISKAFFDAQPDMPSAWTQGVWSNIYNSILSAVGTPLKAALSNTVLMIERPISTFAGAMLNGDGATLRRASYMYNIGIGETFQRSWVHMNQIFKRAGADPSSVSYIMRDDIARKNAGQMKIMREFADAAEVEGNFGPSIFTNHIETLNDLAENPWLRFGANSMSAFDGFTRAWVGNVEARGRAFDAIMEGGGAVTDKRVRAMARRIYSEMFDETGMITDRAVEYSSKEIAMNLDNPLVSSINEFVKRVPSIKPFMMFPKTSINMLRFAGSHNPAALIPLDTFRKNLNAFSLPFEQMDIDEVKRLLGDRGISTRGNIEAAYETVRSELKGRKAIGTAAVLTAGMLFTQDRIRGNGLYDKTRQRTRRELGWKPRTIKSLDGKWYSYDNLGVISDWLALTADIGDNFDTLDQPTMQILFQKAAFILSANITDKSMLSGLEPLGDVLTGNAAAFQRWLAVFGSAAIPGSGFRNELARLMSPQLKEVEMELSQLVANRNPILKEDLPDLYDWMDGSKVGEPMNFLTRVWNVYSPTGKVSESISPEKQFLIDIEFDGRPSLRTNGKGVEYSPEQRSEITRIMGEEGFFKSEVKRIMNSKEGREFRSAWKEAAKQGVFFDTRKFKGIQDQLFFALGEAQTLAEAKLPDYEDILDKQFINAEIDYASEQGDIERILELQQN